MLGVRVRSEEGCGLGEGRGFQRATGGKTARARKVWVRRGARIPTGEGWEDRQGAERVCSEGRDELDRGKKAGAHVARGTYPQLRLGRRLVPVELQELFLLKLELLLLVYMRRQCGRSCQYHGIPRNWARVPADAKTHLF